MTNERLMQLDIFEHSRDVILRNDVVQAIESRDAAAARAACDSLATEFALDSRLEAMRILVKALEDRNAQMVSDHAALATARRQLEEVVTPAAGQALGDGTGPWLAALWEDLARRAEAVKFRPEHALDHAAPLWLCARNWKAAACAVSTIESWRRIPAPLAWMTEARLHTYGLPPTWPLIAELAWMSPRRLEHIVRRCKIDPLLPRLAKTFQAVFEGPDDETAFAWFPAWVLIERSDLEEFIAPAQPSQDSEPERATRLLVEILGLERQGRHHDVVARRKLLRDLNPQLHALYMRLR